MNIATILAGLTHLWERAPNGLGCPGPQDAYFGQALDWGGRDPDNQ